MKGMHRLALLLLVLAMSLLALVLSGCTSAIHDAAERHERNLREFANGSAPRAGFDPAKWAAFRDDTLSSAASLTSMSAGR